MKKKLTLFMALVMIASMLLAACQSSGTPSSSSATSSTAALSSSASQSNSEKELPAGISGPNEFPMVTDGRDFRIAIPTSSSVEDYDTNEQTLEWEEITGTNIIWELLPGSSSEYNEKINILFAAGSGLPDLFLGCNGYFTGTMISTLASQGLLEPLDDMIDTYGYWIPQGYERTPFLKDFATSPDGKMYTVTRYNTSTAGMTGERMYINTTFMEKLGITEFPQTTQEFYDYLLAVKEDDPNENGKSDEIPLIANSTGWGTSIDGFLMMPFIYNSGTDKTYLTPDGKVEWAPIQDGYKEGLKYLKSLYDAGLISTDVFTSSSLNDLVEYEEAMLVGAVPGGGPNAFSNNDGERKKNYRYLEPLQGPDGTRQAMYNPYTGVTLGYGIIPAASKEKEIAYKLLDYLYDPYQFIRSRYGIEGRDWEVPAAGTKAYDGGDAKVLVIGDIQWGNLQNTYLMAAHPFYQEVPSHSTVDNGDPWHLERVIWDASVEYEKYKNAKHLPPVTFTDDEGREKNEIWGNLKTYRELSLAEFVTGIRNIDTDWDAYVAECKKIGSDRMVALYQTAFDRQWAGSWTWFE